MNESSLTGPQQIKIKRSGDLIIITAVNTAALVTYTQPLEDGQACTIHIIPTGASEQPTTNEKFTEMVTKLANNSDTYKLYLSILRIICASKNELLKVKILREYETLGQTGFVTFVNKSLKDFILSEFKAHANISLSTNQETTIYPAIHTMHQYGFNWPMNANEVNTPVYTAFRNWYLTGSVDEPGEEIKEEIISELRSIG